MKYIKSFIGIITFIFILIIVYISYIKNFKVDVVFYASLFVSIISVVLFGIILFLAPFFQSFTNFEKLQHIFICILLGYILAISVPTIIDRSLSFYILEKLQQRGGGIQLSKFNYIFTNEYMREHKLIDVRLTEQVASGTIVINGDCVKLTKRGYRLALFSRYFRKNLLPKQRLLRGEYTDQLTDPFSRSDKSPDYLCK